MEAGQTKANVSTGQTVAIDGKLGLSAVLPFDVYGQSETLNMNTPPRHHSKTIVTAAVTGRQTITTWASIGPEDQGRQFGLNKSNQNDGPVLPMSAGCHYH